MQLLQFWVKAPRAERFLGTLWFPADRIAAENPEFHRRRFKRVLLWESRLQEWRIQTRFLILALLGRNGFFQLAVIGRKSTMHTITCFV